MNNEPITASNLLAAVDYIQKKYGRVPSRLRLSHETFNDLYDYFLEPVEDVEIDETKDRPYDPTATIFGIKIVLDNRMKYGNWRFEP